MPDQKPQDAEKIEVDKKRELRETLYAILGIKIKGGVKVVEDSPYASPFQVLDACTSLYDALRSSPPPVAERETSSPSMRERYESQGVPRCVNCGEIGDDCHCSDYQSMKAAWLHERQKHADALKEIARLKSSLSATPREEKDGANAVVPDDGRIYVPNIKPTPAKAGEGVRVEIVAEIACIDGGRLNEWERDSIASRILALTGKEREGEVVGWAVWRENHAGWVSVSKLHATREDAEKDIAENARFNREEYRVFALISTEGREKKEKAGEEQPEPLPEKSGKQPEPLSPAPSDAVEELAKVFEACSGHGWKERCARAALAWMEKNGVDWPGRALREQKAHHEAVKRAELAVEGLKRITSKCGSPAYEIADETLQKIAADASTRKDEGVRLPVSSPVHGSCDTVTSAVSSELEKARRETDQTSWRTSGGLPVVNAEFLPRERAAADAEIAKWKAWAGFLYGFIEDIGTDAMEEIRQRALAAGVVPCEEPK